MASSTGNPFWWLAGVDSETLSNCCKTEKVKYTGIGMLVLIPAVLGFVAMSYAVATLNSNWYVFVPLALIWAAMILAIDRFMVSTLKKSYSVRKDFRSFNFLLRFVLACGIGTIVSHPLILFVLAQSLQQQMGGEYAFKQQAINTVYSTSVDSLNKKLVAFKKNSVDSAQAVVGCLIKVKAAEANDNYRHTLICNGSPYSISGDPRYGVQARNYQTDLENARAGYKDQHDAYVKFQDQTTKDLQQLANNKDNQLSQLKVNHSTDYLSRMTALEQLEAGKFGSAATRLSWFLLLFFIFLDIVPVVAKVSLPKGEYEFKVDKMEENRIDTARYAFQNEYELEKLKMEKMYNYKRSRIITAKFSDFDTAEEYEAFLNGLS